MEFLLVSSIALAIAASVIDFKIGFMNSLVKNSLKNKIIFGLSIVAIPLFWDWRLYSPVLAVAILLRVVDKKTLKREKKTPKDIQVKKLSILKSVANPSKINFELDGSNGVKNIAMEILPNLKEDTLSMTMMNLRRLFPKQEFSYNLDYENLRCDIEAIKPLPKIVVLDDERNIHSDHTIDLAVDESLRPVSWIPKRNPHLYIGGATGGGKSSMLNAILYQMLSRPDVWEMSLVDMKRTEFRVYDNPTRFPNVLTVATTKEEVEEVMFKAESLMYQRAEELENLTLQDGKVHNDYIETFGAKRHVVIMDEVYEAFLGSKEAKAKAAAIGRLGRALGVHLILATQRPDASVMGGGLMNNMTGRVCCGPVKTFAASMMILGNASGTLIPGDPKGRTLISWRLGTVQGLYVPDDKMNALSSEGKMTKPNSVVKLLAPSSGEESIEDLFG